MKNCISINTKKDNILIKINESAEQVEILEALKKKLPDLKKLYKDDETPIMITGKVLKNREIVQIKNLIQKSIDVKISFDSPTKLGLHSIIKTYNKDILISETRFHKGALRSGQKIEYEGSLVILGDVNDGAEVIAGENIVILGTLRGLAHAGAKGNKNAIIAAESIEAQQLRIANIVKEIEKEEILTENSKRYVYVNEKSNIIME